MLDTSLPLGVHSSLGFTNHEHVVWEMSQLSPLSSSHLVRGVKGTGNPRAYI